MKRQNSFLLASATTMLISMMAVCCTVSASSLLTDPDAEAVVQQNKRLSAPISNSTSAQLKSPGKAFLFSAVVPGTGEFYSGAKRGVLFAAAEIAFWAAYIVIHGQAEDSKDDYVSYVDDHILFEEGSPATSTEEWTLEDYEHATQSDNWHYVYTEENGKPIDRVGKFYWDDLTEERIDQPGSVDMVSQNRAEAFEKRGSTNDKFKQAKRFLGLVVVNHIVSAIDARIAATVYNNRISESGAEISFHPTVSPLGQVGARLALCRQF